MLNAHEIELRRLHHLITDLQRMLFLNGGGGLATTTSILVQSLGDAERKLAGTERAEITAREEEERKQQQELAAAIVMAERELKLSHAERQEFASFLKCEYFTRIDFGRLENFYTNTWDRLTEAGKAEMSCRVWGGIRRGEFEFQDMPEVIKEKEAASLREALGAGNRDLEAIPETDRSDFINSWDAGRKKESYQLLDRPSFAKAVSVTPAVVPEKEVTSQAVKADVVKDKINAKTGKVQAPATTPEVMGSIEFKSDDLSEVSLCTPDIKTPLSNHKKPAGPPGKTH